MYTPNKKQIKFLADNPHLTIIGIATNKDTFFVQDTLLDENGNNYIYVMLPNCHIQNIAYYNQYTPHKGRLSPITFVIKPYRTMNDYANNVAIDVFTFTTNYVNCGDAMRLFLSGHKWVIAEYYDIAKGYDNSGKMYNY